MLTTVSLYDIIRGKMVIGNDEYIFCMEQRLWAFNRVKLYLLNYISTMTLDRYILNRVKEMRFMDIENASLYKKLVIQEDGVVTFTPNKDYGSELWQLVRKLINSIM